MIFLHVQKLCPWWVLIVIDVAGKMFGAIDLCEYIECL